MGLKSDISDQDEVLAITEKVVIRVEDLLTWITQATDWHWGLGAIWGKNSSSSSFSPPCSFSIDMEDINKEKEALEPTHWETQVGVVVLSYPRYCRYRGVMKRLQGVEEEWMKTSMIVALGGFTCPWKNTRILFCKETFDYPELEGHELLCNHLAPKLKGRPRKRKRTNQSPTESETESESSQSTASSSTSKAKTTPKSANVKPRLRCTLEVSKRPTRGPTTEERNFISALHVFMKERKTPIARIPIVGFKEVNLFKLYKKVSELGGYDVVTASKLWKYVYEVMGGDMTSTSAATLSRRHYEKLLLPYERHLNGSRSPPKPKPALALPPAPHPTNQQQTAANKDNKGSSLRSIRLKQEKVTGGKENIPQRREVEVTTGKPIKVEPEIIDLVSDEPPTIKTEGGKRLPIISSSTPRALSPLIKKQKLEILKEGGLEVTPVGGPVTGSSGSRSSVIKASITHAPSRMPTTTTPIFRESKVSITVTPDMSHLLSPGPSSSSKRPVYGNPKEMFSPPPPSPSGEILDLRTKPRINIGSNLEITLVPPTKTGQHGKGHFAQPQHRAPTSTHAQHHHNHNHNHRGKPSPAGMPYLPYHAYKPGATAAAYMPVLDHHRSVYLSALYNNMYRSYTPQPIPQVSSNVYKELLRRQGIFPSLDGTTSITLVGQTPTSK